MLVIQCIDVFGFAPARSGLRFFVDDNEFFPIGKESGCYIMTKQLPSEFVLSIKSDIYFDYQRKAALNEEILSVNLLRKAPPPRKKSVWLAAKASTTAALEYGYFHLESSAKKSGENIFAENPYRFCLEGRSFLLLDTSTGAEEFVTMKKAENAAMTQYLVNPIMNAYSTENSVLLPAFDVYVNAKIPLERPFKGVAAVRLYDENGKFIEKAQADEALQ